MPGEARGGQGHTVSLKGLVKELDPGQMCTFL